MINTSFTLRPSTTNNSGDDNDAKHHHHPGVELTLRQVSDSTRVSSTIGINEYQNDTERVFKRRRLFTDRPSISSSFNDDDDDDDEDIRLAVEPTLSTHHTTTVRTTTTSRLPVDFEPPNDENYWKRRCFIMQSICKETRSKMREMVEDSRQLRHRIHILEKQLLRQQSLSLAAESMTVVHDPTREGEERKISTLEAREDSNGDENDHRDTKRCGTRTTTNGDDAVEQKNISGTTTRAGTSLVPPPAAESATPRRRRTRTPPAVLTIPKHESAAASSCFYLTDGEGLSDSEFHDDDEDVYDEECHHHRDDDENDDDDDDVEARNDTSPPRQG
jgi:hypothetical protein